MAKQKHSVDEYIKQKRKKPSIGTFVKIDLEIYYKVRDKKGDISWKNLINALLEYYVNDGKFE